MTRPVTFLSPVIFLVALLLVHGTLTAQTPSEPLTGFGGVSLSDEIGLMDPADTLSLRLTDNRILQAELEMKRTTFWRRIIPEVRLSGSIGVRDILFLDPATATPYLLPRDSYRIMLGLSISEAFNFDKHSMAVLQHDQLLIQRKLMVSRLRSSETTARRQYEKLLIELKHLQEESQALSQLAEYTELLFNEGEKQFDDLIRVRFQKLNLRKAMNRIALQLNTIPRPVLGAVDFNSMQCDSIPSSAFPVDSLAHDSTSRSRRTVTFHLSQADTLTMSVYNILGNLVASLGSRSFEKGDHTVPLDGLELHAGVYFLVVEGSSFRIVRQLVWVP